MPDKIARAVVATLAAGAVYVLAVALYHVPIMAAIVPIGVAGGWALHRTKLL